MPIRRAFRVSQQTAKSHKALTVALVSDHHREHGLDALRRPGGQEDVLRVRRLVVTLFEEGRHRLAHQQQA